VSSRELIAHTPLIISCPHAGRHFPNDLTDKIDVSLHELDRRGDTFTEWLSMGAVDLGAFQIMSSIAPTYMNVGRSHKSISPEDVRDWNKRSISYDLYDIYAPFGQGLVSTLSYHSGLAIYKQGMKPNAAEILARTQKWHTPFHAVLNQAARNTANTIAQPLVFDVHSCPSSSKTGGEIKADTILSDAEGRACDPKIMEAASKLAREFGYRVAVNKPYKGGYITQRYGRHGEYGTQLGSQALQIEFNRKSYGLNEETLEIESRAKFDQARDFMTELSRELIDQLSR